MLVTKGIEIERTTLDKYERNISRNEEHSLRFTRIVRISVIGNEIFQRKGKKMIRKIKSGCSAENISESEACVLNP